MYQFICNRNNKFLNKLNCSQENIGFIEHRRTEIQSDIPSRMKNWTLGSLKIRFYDQHIQNLKGFYYPRRVYFCFLTEKNLYVVPLRFIFFFSFLLSEQSIALFHVLLIIKPRRRYYDEVRYESYVNGSIKCCFFLLHCKIHTMLFLLALDQYLKDLNIFFLLRFLVNGYQFSGYYTGIY